MTSDDLIADHDLIKRRSIDTEIASVSLRCGANNPESGLPITLTVGFGIEEITLTDGFVDVSTSIAIKKSQVQLYTTGCEIEALGAFDPERPNSGSQVQFQRRDGTADLQNVRFGAELSTPDIYTGKSFSFFGSMSRRRRSEKLREEKVTRESQLPVIYQRIPEIVTFDETLQDQNYLQGMYASSHHVWNLRPLESQSWSAVVAQLIVRKNWIDLNNPTLEFVRNSDEERRSRRVFEVLNGGEKYSNEIKSLAFDILIKHCFFQGLQGGKSGNFAVLASDGIIVRELNREKSNIVHDGELERVSSELNIPLHIVPFLEGTPDQMIQSLHGIGVAQSDLSKLSLAAGVSKAEGVPPNFDRVEFDVIEKFLTETIRIFHKKVSSKLDIDTFREERLLSHEIQVRNSALLQLLRLIQGVSQHECWEKFAVNRSDLINCVNVILNLSEIHDDRVESLYDIVMCCVIICRLDSERPIETVIKKNMKTVDLSRIEVASVGCFILVAGWVVRELPNLVLRCSIDSKSIRGKTAAGLRLVMQCDQPHSAQEVAEQYGSILPGELVEYFWDNLQLQGRTVTVRLL